MTDADLKTNSDILAAQHQTRARELAATFARTEPTAIRRFTTGAGHYVFEAAFADRAPLAIRITQPGDRALCENAAALSRQLRPLGVPLPELLEDGSMAPLPYLLLERLPGVDLREVLNGLTDGALLGIAGRVADAQAIAAATRSAGRYGYAAVPDQAPVRTWSEVLDANLGRARRRIAAAKLFDGAAIATTAALVDVCRDELNRTPATPFLHDTTTKNVIVTAGGQFSGIVDVDDLCFGDPRYAIALTFAAVRAQGGPVAYVDHWLWRAGYEADRLFWLYVAVFIVDFMSEHGQSFNGNQQPSTHEQRQHLLRLFQDTTAKIHRRPRPGTGRATT